MEELMLILESIQDSFKTCLLLCMILVQLLQIVDWIINSNLSIIQLFLEFIFGLQQHQEPMPLVPLTTLIKHYLYFKGLMFALIRMFIKTFIILVVNGLVETII